MEKISSCQNSSCGEVVSEESQRKRQRTMTVREIQNPNQNSSSNESGPETQEATSLVSTPQLITLETIRLEQQYDILDSKGRWCEGEVLE